jgi:hypothetical protein
MLPMLHFICLKITLSGSTNEIQIEVHRNLRLVRDAALSHRTDPEADRFLFGNRRCLH